MAGAQSAEEGRESSKSWRDFPHGFRVYQGYEENQARPEMFLQMWKVEKLTCLEKSTWKRRTPKPPGMNDASLASNFSKKPA